MNTIGTKIINNFEVLTIIGTIVSSTYILKTDLKADMQEMKVDTDKLIGAWKESTNNQINAWKESTNNQINAWKENTDRRLDFIENKNRWF